MEPTKPKNSARIEKMKKKLEDAQKLPLREGFLSQDKFPPRVKSPPQKSQIS
jgi:hypothetical protein